MGGGGSQTVGYRYFLGMHMVCTMGPVDSCYEIRVGDKTAWNGIANGGRITINAPNLFGGDSDEGGITGDVDFLLGGPTQGVNDYLQGVLGDGPIPAFRGVSSFVLRQVYLSNNPYLKNWSFGMTRIHTRQDGLTQWNDSKAEITTTIAGISGTVLVTDSQIDSIHVGSDSATDPNLPHITGLETTDTLIVTLLGEDGIYPAGSAFPSDSDNGGLTWGASFSINENDSGDPGTTIGTFINVGGVLYPTEAAAAAALKGQTFIFTGYTSYTMWIPGSPPHPRGGVSASIGILRGIKDMNPAHIIRECLTDPDWGMGYNEADIDDTSFIAAADTLYTEQMGISLLWSTQTDIGDFITQVLTHIDAVCFVDRTSGLFVLTLIRDDYVVADLLELTEDDIDHIEDFKRPQFGELTTSVTVQYWDGISDTQGSVTIQDIALEQMQGAAINTTVQYIGFSNITIATRAAQRDLRSLSTEIASCTVYTDRIAKGLQIGSVFKLTWPDYELSSVPMRVTGMGYGDGKTNRIRITCIEDVFSLDTAPFIVKPPPIWSDPSGPPSKVINQQAFEFPYYALVRQTTQATVDTGLTTQPDGGYVGVALGRPTSGVINAPMYTDAGTGYTNNSVADFCPTAQLLAGIDEMQTIVPIQNGDELSLVAAGDWCQIENEIVRIDAISDTSMTIARACMDTLPAKHAASVEVYFWSVGSGQDPTQYVSGESLNVKVTPKTGSGVLDIAKATAMNVVMGSRAIRPYPPGNLKLNGNYFPPQVEGNTVLTWVHRDRTQETGGTLVSFTDATIGPETGVTYTMKVYNHAGTLVRTVSGISANTTTYTSAQEATDGGPFSPDFRITLESVRGSYSSFFKYSLTLSHPAPIILRSVFLPSSDQLQHPISMTYNNGAFLVAVAGTVGFDNAYGIYKIPAAGGDPIYFGSTDDNRFGAGTLLSPKDYVPAHLTYVLPNNMNDAHSLLTASGIDVHFSLYWGRAGTDDPTSVKWLLVGDDSLGTLSSVVTDSSINDDIVGLVRKADGTQYAICSGNTSGAPAKLYKSTTNGVSWSYQGTVTGLNSLEPVDGWFSKMFEMDDHSLVWLNGGSYVNAAGDGLAWVRHDIESSFASQDIPVDAAYDGTDLCVIGQITPPATFDALVASDGPISRFDWTGSGFMGADIWNDQSDLTRIIRFSPGGIGVTGAGWGHAPGLTSFQVQTGPTTFVGSGIAIATVHLTYIEPRTATNSAINQLQGTTDFTIEFWVADNTAGGTVGPPTPGNSVLFSQCRGGNPQFENVLLTFNSVGNVLRFRTIRQTGTSTYATDVDLSVSVGYNIYSAPDFLPRMVTVTRGTGGRVFMYINGTQVGTVASGPITDLTVTGATQLGCVWGNTSSGAITIDGVGATQGDMILDSLCLYNKELSGAQISAHYAAAQADNVIENRIYKSSDRGVTWTKQRHVAYKDDNWGSGVTRWDTIRKFGTGFVVYGVEPTSGAFPQALFSTDHGATWGSITAVVTSDGTNNSRILQCVSNGSRIMATTPTKIISGTHYLQLAYSDDGINFTDIDGSTFPPGSSGINLIVLDDTGDPRIAETSEIRITED